jgi:hypothetical protein
MQPRIAAVVAVLASAAFAAFLVTRGPSASSDVAPGASTPAPAAAPLEPLPAAPPVLQTSPAEAPIALPAPLPDAAPAADGNAAPSPIAAPPLPRVRPALHRKPHHRLIVKARPLGFPPQPPAPALPCVPCWFEELFASIKARLAALN